MNIRKLLKNTGALGVVAMVFYTATAHAYSADTFGPGAPPQGWDHLCTGNSIQVKPFANSRTYAGSGTCWVIDNSTGSWIDVKVTLQGSFAIQSKTFAERLSFAIGSHTVPVEVSGACEGDPWETTAQCSSSAPTVDLQQSFGWSITPPPGPLSRNIFGTGLVQALLSNQVSKPPLAPVDLKALRMPSNSGKGTTVGQVGWDLPDLSGNKWILQFDIEYSTASPNSAFTKAGQVAGPGMKTNVAQWEVGRGFLTPFKLQDGLDYYFRVCSVNDAGRACTLVKARQPTKAELISASSPTRLSGGIAPAQPGNPTTSTVAAGKVGVFGSALSNRGGPGNGPTTVMSASGANTGAAGTSSAATVARGSPLPDLTFSFVTVEKTTYPVTPSPGSIVVYDHQREAAACQQPFSFPLQLIVKNIGQADFVVNANYADFEVVGVNIVVGVNTSAWNSAKNLANLSKGASHGMDFNVTLPPGSYTLQAMIDLHNTVAEARSDNNTLSWPLEVKCDIYSLAPAPVLNGGFGSKRAAPVPVR